jgi:GGDEF domain-containing protein
MLRTIQRGLAALVRHPAETPSALALAMEILFVAIALTTLQLARRHPPAPWLGFATAALDVTFVSFYHVMIFVSVADAAAKIEEIRRTVSATPIPLRVRAVVTISCSAGVAVAPLDGTDAESLIAIAAARLLKAKKLGRDRLMVAG